MIRRGLSRILFALSYHLQFPYIWCFNVAMRLCSKKEKNR